MTAPDELPNSTPPVEPVSSTPETASAPSGPVSEASVPAKSEPAVVLPAVTPPTPPEPAPEPQPVPAVPKSPQPQEASRMAQDFQIRRAQVDTVLKLFEDGASVPYVARYCQEQTGGLPEELLRRIHDRLKALKALAERKQTILKSIAMMGKLNDDLTQAILTAEHPKRLDDLYLPFKPKKKSVAGDAREKGLEPLAKAIWTRDAAVEKLDEVLPGMVDAWKQLHDVGDVLAGVKHILAEYVSERPDVRGALRAFLWDTAVLRSKRVETLPEGKGKDFHEFFDFEEPVALIPPHRVLGVNRGEREQILRLHIDADNAVAVNIVADCLDLASHPHKDLMLQVAQDAVEKLLRPNLDREIRRDLTERAQDQAVGIFARNLRGLLMQPPLKGKRVLAIDPGLRTGCKLAALDENGELLEDAIVHPHPPKKELETATRKIEQFIRKHQLQVIALGNGTACRETEHLISDLLSDLANRKLSPTATVAKEPTLTSDTATPPAAEVPVEKPADDAKPAESTATPEAPTQTPAAEPAPTQPTAEVPASVVEPMTTTMTLSSPLGAAETSMAIVTPVFSEASIATSETTASADAIAAQVVMTTAAPATTAAAAPPPPVIDLTGLPDAPAGLAYVIVNEAGAGDYGNSPAAREEFPNLDPALRSAISIGRRLQDPLAELVKIDPQHIGVGLYQHDLRPKHLRETLEAVIESCVNHIGVDLNTAGPALLRHVSGLNALAARDIVAWRAEHGPFKTREQLKTLPQVGEARAAQAMGFVKVEGGDEPLDRTWILPEHYPLAKLILADLGFGPKELADKARVEALRAKLNTTDVEGMAKKLNAQPARVDALFAALARPGRDPRDDMPPPIVKTGMMKIEDLQPGMELQGTVQNVVPFGAFVDVGVKESGLIHISQLANRYIKSPHDLISVGDVVTVWVMEVKPSEKKISLTMIPPKRERPPMEPRMDRPPMERGPRPDGPRPPMGMGPRPDGAGGQGRPPQRRSFDRRPGPDETAHVPMEPPKPRKPAAPVKLTDEKKTGKAALNTFGELSAFFKTREPEPAKAIAPPEPAADAPKAAEAPAPQAPATDAPA